MPYRETTVPISSVVVRVGLFGAQKHHGYYRVVHGTHAVILDGYWGHDDGEVSDNTVTKRDVLCSVVI